jgi:hypothetical protein
MWKEFEPMSMAAKRSRAGTAASPGAPADPADPAVKGSPEMPEIGNFRGWTTTVGKELTRAIVAFGARLPLLCAQSGDRLAAGERRGDRPRRKPSLSLGHGLEVTKPSLSRNDPALPGQPIRHTGVTRGVADFVLASGEAASKEDVIP